MRRRKLPEKPFRDYRENIESLPFVNRLFNQRRCYLYYERDIPPEELPDLMKATDILVKDFIALAE